MQQSLPDSFYYSFFFYGMLLFLTERVWHLGLTYAFSRAAVHPGDKQWKRYATVGAGMATSLLVLFSLLSQYSLNEVKTGLNQMYAASPWLGVGMWATFVIHVVTVPAMIFFWLWYYVRPLREPPHS